MSESAVTVEDGRRRAGPGRLGGAAATVAAAVLLAPWLRPGAILVRDLVVVADPGWSTALLTPSALPREVPGEVLVALLGQAAPGGLVVRAALLTALVALGAGAGRLAGGTVAAVVAGTAAVWNPYVLARLQQGQWLVVVAMAAVPWVVVHLAARDLPRLLRALVLSCLAGFLAVVVVVPTLVLGGVALRRTREVAVGLVTVAIMSLPWAVVTGPVASDPDGFAAFAPSADLAAGVGASLLAGGGHFNLAVASPWRASVVVTVLALILTAVALGGVSRWRAGPARVALVTSAVVGLVVAVLAATVVGRSGLVAVADVLPQVSVVRDAQRLLAPWVVLLAVGVGVAAAVVGARARATVAAGLAAVLLVLVVLPDPLLGPRLPGPAALPDAWTEAAAMIDAAPPRPVLVVPHGSTQRYPFTDWRPVHVPLQRLVGAPVLTDRRLVVETADGARIVVDEEAGQSRERALAAAWPGTSIGDDLADIGVGWVAVTDPARMVAAAPTGMTVVFTSASIQLLRVDADVRPTAAPWWVLGVDLVVLLAALGIVVGAGPWARRTRTTTRTRRETSETG